MSFASKIPLPVYISSAICGIFGISVLIKQRTGGDYYEGPTRAEGKVVIVTGANCGIGKETVWELARRGAKVYMACKDMERCEEARKDIVLDTKNKYIYCRSCDLASLDSIRQFVNRFKSEEEKLDILINNAGVMRTPKGSKTKEGFEMQLGVNHLGHFLLTNLLLGNLKKSAPSRVINLSCICYKRGKINKDDLNSTLSYDPATAYEQSKLANVLFTKELAAKLAGTGVTVNAENPGVVDTDLVRHMGFSKSSFASIIFKPLTWPFVRSPRQGCQGVVYLALDPALERISGQYFRFVSGYWVEEGLDIEKGVFSNVRVEDVNQEAADSELAKWLWRVSEKWTRLTSV